MGSSVRVSRVVSAPIERVWEVITDLDHAADVLTGVSRVERLDTGSYQVGTTWRETRKMMGKEATEQMWVAEVDAPRRTVVRSDNRGVEYRTVIELRSRGESTEIAMEFSANAPQQSGLKKTIYRVIAPVGTSITKKMLTTDLADIAAAAERA